MYIANLNFTAIGGDVDFLTFRSGRQARNQSKRFPTREFEQEIGAPAQIPSPALKKPQSPSALNREKNHHPGAKSKASKEAKRPSVKPEKEIEQAAEFKGEPIAVPSPIELRPKGESESPVSVLHPFSPEPVIPEISKQSMEDLKTSGSHSGDFELKPPPSKPKESLETLSRLLYSEVYLKVLTSDIRLLGCFTTFLSRYKPYVAHLIPSTLRLKR